MPNTRHLSLFAIDRHSGKPISRLPFYAEIGAPAPAPATPVETDRRFDEPIIAAILKLDNDCATSPTCRERVLASTGLAMVRVIPKENRAALAKDQPTAAKLFIEVFRRTINIAGGKLRALSPDALNTAIEDGLRQAANKLKIPVVTQPPEESKSLIWAYPLGVLASDHVGYLSFDLSRLPQSVLDAVEADILARKTDAAGSMKTSIQIYPLLQNAQPFDGYEQGRFTDDAIIVRAELSDPSLPESVRNLGMLAMQNPDLTDWRLSPSSFAVNPGMLVGQDGCESLLPANVALQEFYFYQVVRLNDATLQPLIPDGLKDKVRVGLIHEYRLAWYPLGHSLGQIQYSLPLAPGESVNLAVVDWTRRDDAQRAEHTTMDEQLVHNEHRDRTITETVDAAVQEYQKGSSFMGGLAQSAGASASYGGMIGGAIGTAWSLGGSTANSSGSRNIAANTVQKLSDNISQASASKRELQSTVVVHSVQAEKEAIETRTVVNYNHSHALTILYYEVLRHFRLVTERVATRPAVLVQYEVKSFYPTVHIPAVPPVPAIDMKVDTGLLTVNRAVIKAGLLEASLGPGFDALERIEQRRRLETQTPTPFNPGNLGFVYFEIAVHTGGFSNVNVALFGALYGGPDQLVELATTNLNPPGGPNNLQSFGSFKDGDHEYVFYAVTKDKVARKWSDIRAIRLGFGGVNKDIPLGIKHISIIGSDMLGTRQQLVEWNGDYVFYNDTDLVLETTHPVSPAVPTPTVDELSDQAALVGLLDHLEQHKEYYNRLIWLSEDPLIRAGRFDTDPYKWKPDSTLLDHLDNRPVEIISSWVAFPTPDNSINDAVQALELAQDGNAEQPNQILNERLVTLPTRGVFAEAKLGHCNASEEIDNTRFWDWQQSPIPHLAPEIAPVTAVTPQPQQQNLQPTPFPQSLVNIVNPPSAPDPVGLAAAMNVLGTPNIFRDMSGQAQVADLLKKLSDNSISIAQAANQARGILGTSGGQSSGGGVGSSSGGGNGGGFGARATPTQPSATTRDLQDLRNEMKQGVNDGLLTADQAAPAYTNAVNRVADGQSLSSPSMAPFLPPPPLPVNPQIFDFKVQPGGLWMETSCLPFGFEFKGMGIDVKIPIKVGVPTSTIKQGQISISKAQIDSADSAWFAASNLLVYLNNFAKIPSEGIEIWFRTQMQIDLLTKISSARVSSCSGGFRPGNFAFQVSGDGDNVVLNVDAAPTEV